MKTSSTIENTVASIIQQGVLPLYFNPNTETSLEIVKALYRAGIKIVEYTNRDESSLAVFRKLVEYRNVEIPDLKLGAGTIKDLATAVRFLEAGADFLVSPGYVSAIADYAVPKDHLYVPGCMTATEIIMAETAGIRFIKLFPGSILGPSFVSQIRDIFPQIKFMPTGGVDCSSNNLEAWFSAGVSAVGMGSKLISKELMAAKDYSSLEQDTRQLLQLIEGIRKNFKTG